MKATLVEMGNPVFSGGFSTFLAFILLAASKSYVFTTFFQVRRARAQKFFFFHLPGISIILCALNYNEHAVAHNECLIMYVEISRIKCTPTVDLI